MSEHSFVHLRCHSEYSIRDSIVRIQDLIERVKCYGMPAVALSDHSNLFALVKFYRQAIAAGIKPIIGADLRLYEQGVSYPFSCYCRNLQGYCHLTQLISDAYLKGQRDGSPTVQWEWVEKYADGLLVLSGGARGDVGCALRSGDTELARQRLQRWATAFPDCYYLELQRLGREGEEEYLQAAVKMAALYSLPVVATNEICFLSAKDFEAHEARVCIYSGNVLNDPKRDRSYQRSQYLKSSEEMAALFADLPEALENTLEIAKRCTLELSLGKHFFPTFPAPSNTSLENCLQESAQAGLARYLTSLPSLSPQKETLYRARLKEEVDVITVMGFSGYFLIVADFINWSKSQKIPVGPGRGSGAGSLVAFCLGITGLDPIEHDLLFERFLNPERVSMPDFDIDFCMERRDEVIDYVAERYGRQAVSQIITYGTLAAKAVIRDVGRVLGMPYNYVDKIAKLVPFELGMTLRKALEQEEQLASLYQEEEEVKALIDLAMKLEGLVRNAGKHAGGVVIAPTKLTDFTPLYCEPSGENVVTQFDKDDVEAVGLVKFDFLGLRTLTIIHKALVSIDEVIQIDQLSLEDQKTYELVCRGETTAVFQLESRAMKDLIHRLQPNHFEDLTALVALIRPGPMQSGMVDDYINCKHGRAKVHYPHPDLEPILKTTYGVILYQEQVMQIARVLAGYTLGQADILRRAMGKKKPEEMAKQREVFINGAQQRGVSREISEHVFNLMEKFAGYGFNKSHSAAYALISYQTAWLKAHYPNHFMAAVLSSDMDNTDKVLLFLNECKAMGLVVRDPDLNAAQYEFFVNTEGDLVYGLGAIKGVGEGAALSMIEERQSNGSYKNLFEFCCRVDAKKVNKRVIESLILSGAMDCFSQPRASLWASLKKAMKIAEQFHRDRMIGQTDLFSGADDFSQMDRSEEYVAAPPWTVRQKLQGEKEALGYYRSGHPMQAYEKETIHFITAPIQQIDKVLHKTAVIAGMISALRVIHTKRGRRLAILTIEDATGQIEVTLFSQVYDAVARELQKDLLVVLRGKVEEDSFNEGVRLVAESLETLDQVRQRLAKRLVIQVRGEQAKQLTADLPALMRPFCGGVCPVAIDYQNEHGRACFKLGDTWQVTPQEELLFHLKNLCGEQAVVLEYE